jgi:hypothetical protein
MPPPPVPWFRGRTIVVTPVATPRGGALVFKALGRGFGSLAGQRELTVPLATLVLVVAEGAALGLRGIFADTKQPADVVLGPIDPDDAQQVERVLAERANLPRIPRRVSASDLSTCEQGAFVLVDDAGTRTVGFVLDGELVPLDPPAR